MVVPTHAAPRPPKQHHGHTCWWQVLRPDAPHPALHPPAALPPPAAQAAAADASLVQGCWTAPVPLQVVQDADITQC